MNNYLQICKEILIKCLKNKSRQIRELQPLIDSLGYLCIEGNKAENEFMSGRNKKKSGILTNLLVKQVLNQMDQYIWNNIKLEIYSGYELDSIFYLCENIIKYQSFNINIINSKFAEKILKEENFIKSNAKKKLSPTQKMLLDQIYIYNGLKLTMKALTMIIVYLKRNKLIIIYQNEE